jgi:hypothetical protein
MSDKSKHPGRGGARHGARSATSRSRSSGSLSSTARVDFTAINRAALLVLPTILARWLPGGRRAGREYLGLNPKRADRHLGSFKIVVSGPRAGVWADFATGNKGGDVISLGAYLFELSQTSAANRIAAMLGLCRD